MLRAVTAVVIALFLYSAAPIHARDHCDVHYRWQEKIDATHLGDTSTHTTISTIFSWASPAFTAANMYWCQSRNTREQTVYEVTAWARRLKVEKSGTNPDGDWHIELTGSKTSSVYNCIVVEIPPDTLNPAYFQARQDFLNVIGNAGATIKEYWQRVASRAS